MAIKHLIIISLDAVTGREAELLCTLPAMGALAARGALTTNVSSVFISNTYPAHTSIVTGKLPHEHGVAENCLYQPQYTAPDWRWYRRYIRCNTLYDAARAAGLTVCSVMWPVTARANIRWNMPEIFSPRSLWRQPFVSLANGNVAFQLAALYRYSKHLSGMSQPGLDDFVLATGVSAFVRHRPNLMMLHLCDVDTNKHMYGPGSPEAQGALERHDKRLSLLIAAVEQAGCAQDTAYLLLGDHGCLPVEDEVDPAPLLSAYRDIANWQLAGGTAYLHVKTYEEGLRQRLLAHVTGLQGYGGIGRLLTDEEMAVSGMDADCLCGIEAAEGVCFGKPGGSIHKGQHGYSLQQPQDLYTTFYMLSQPSGGAVRHFGGCITDIAGIAARTLNIPWEGA